MALYRKRPVVIDAVQFFPDDLEKYSYAKIKVSGGQILDESTNELIDYKLYYVATLEGWMLITPGDYLITGIKGEHYPCREDIFLDTYEEV